MDSGDKILVYGYGNPGRQDDGLGSELIRMLDLWLFDNNIDQVTTDTNYQLNIEDAANISNYKMVVFVDASIEDIEQYTFTSVSPSDARVEFSMHAVSPSFVIDLCQKLYQTSPEAWLLHIKGYEWDFKEELSENAKKNLEAAFSFLIGFLESHLCF